MLFTVPTNSTKITKSVLVNSLQLVETSSERTNFIHWKKFYIQGPPCNVFFSVLSPCLFWQIISFILSPKEYVCVYAWITLENTATLLLPILTKQIIFSEEAHLNLCGYVNKQNCCICGTKNPHAYIERPTHPKRVTVWCGFWSRGSFLRKWARRDRWPSLSAHVERIFIHKNWRGGYWQHLVSTRRRYVPPSRSNTRPGRLQMR